MEYSKEFLKEFKVDTGQTYIVVPVDGKLYEVSLRRKIQTKNILQWFEQKNHL